MKRVRVTMELPASFVKLLAAKAALCGWTKWAAESEEDDLKVPPEMDAGSIVAWLILMEARGETEDRIAAFTPPMWRPDGPRMIHNERRVIDTDQKKEGGVQYRLIDVGRDKFNGTVIASSASPEHVEAAVLQEAKKHLASRGIDIGIAEDGSEGTIYAGGRGVGRFERVK